MCLETTYLVMEHAIRPHMRTVHTYVHTKFLNYTDCTSGVCTSLPTTSTALPAGPGRLGRSQWGQGARPARPLTAPSRARVANGSPRGRWHVGPETGPMAPCGFRVAGSASRARLPCRWKRRRHRRPPPRVCSDLRQPQRPPRPRAGPPQQPLRWRRRRGGLAAACTPAGAWQAGSCVSRELRARGQCSMRPSRDSEVGLVGDYMHAHAWRMRHAHTQAYLACAASAGGREARNRGHGPGSVPTVASR